MVDKRIIRGFRRLGIVLAIPFFAASIFCLAGYAYSVMTVQHPALPNPASLREPISNQPQDTKPLPPGAKEILKQYGVVWPPEKPARPPPDDESEEDFMRRWGIEPAKPAERCEKQDLLCEFVAEADAVRLGANTKLAPHPDSMLLFWAAVLFGISAALFASSLGIGWTLAGFAKE
jgi:hypothetical protein